MMAPVFPRHNFVKIAEVHMVLKSNDGSHGAPSKTTPGWNTIYSFSTLWRWCLFLIIEKYVLVLQLLQLEASGLFSFLFLQPLSTDMRTHTLNVTNVNTHSHTTQHNVSFTLQTAHACRDVVQKINMTRVTPLIDIDCVFCEHKEWKPAWCTTEEASASFTVK